MSILRCILAVFFAIVIANPACCCPMDNLAGQTGESTACHSKCCEQDEKAPLSHDAPDHRACNCDEGPRALTEQPQLIVASPEFILPTLFASDVAAEDLTRNRDLPAPVIAPADTGPHLRRLARFQRFLI